MKLIAWHTIVTSTGRMLMTGEVDRDGAPVMRPESREYHRGETFSIDNLIEVQELLRCGAAFAADDPDNDQRFAAWARADK